MAVGTAVCGHSLDNIGFLLFNPGLFITLTNACAIFTRFYTAVNTTYIDFHNHNAVNSEMVFIASFQLAGLG
jgi:hypothetical protein